MKKAETLFRITKDGIFYRTEDLQEIEEFLRFHYEHSKEVSNMLKRVVGIPVKIEDEEDIRFITNVEKQK